MLNNIEQFQLILCCLNNYDSEEKTKNKDTILAINNLLLNKANDISDKTYEWQCYLLIMHHQTIKELINAKESNVTYVQFRSNLINSFKSVNKYNQLNESVLMYYPKLVVEETESKKKEDEENSNEIPNIYYKEEMSFDNSESSLIYEEIDIDEVKEINEIQERPLEIEPCEREKQLKQHDHLIEQYFNSKSVAFIQRSQKENQQKIDQLQPMHRFPQQPQQQPPQQQPQYQSKAIQSQFNIKSDYIIDSNSNDSTKRIEELIDKINAYASIISFIQDTVNTNETPISTQLHNYLSLIPKKSYDNSSINKIITLSLFFFPFLTENQKNSNIDRIKSILSKQELITPLLTNLFFISPEKENRQFVTDIICNILYQKPIAYDLINKKLHSIQTLDDIKDLFFLQLLVSIILANQNNLMSLQLELAFSNISFMMIYIIKNEKAFPTLNIHQFLLDCYTMKRLYDCYSLHWNSLLSIESEKSISIIFNNEKLNKSKSDMTIKEYQSYLIDKSIRRRYKATLSSIKHFYTINDFSLPRMISNENLQFALANNELQYIHFKLKNSNVSSYRKMLIKLECNIYQIAKNTFKHHSPIFSTFTIPRTVLNIFSKLQANLKKKFPSWIFTLYPFGSITQLLGSNDSDLDVYLDLNSISKDYRVFFVKRLFNYIQELDRRAFNRNSFRICLISFTFQGLKIDLSCFALCPYLHSNLIRCYSLMDSRFPILAVSLKQLLSVLNLKNDNEKNSTLNSFCWIMLLIVFLQDIITPPILPKLLMNSKSVGKIIEIGGGKPKNSQQEHQSHYKQGNYHQNNRNKKTINDVFENTSFHYIEVSHNSFANYEEIYNENIKEKNMMSLSELFLKFLEFVIFLFKYDTVFPSFTFFNECYMNLSDIKDQIQDFGLRRFYFNRYLPNPKGSILFREPFDYNYNPGQSLNDANTFFEKLKEAYYTLLEFGTFDPLAYLKNNRTNTENTKVADDDDD